MPCQVWAVRQCVPSCLCLMRCVTPALAASPQRCAPRGHGPRFCCYPLLLFWLWRAQVSSGAARFLSGLRLGAKAPAAAAGHMPLQGGAAASAAAPAGSSWTPLYFEPDVTMRCGEWHFVTLSCRRGSLLSLAAGINFTRDEARAQPPSLINPSPLLTRTATLLRCAKRSEMGGIARRHFSVWTRAPPHAPPASSTRPSLRRESSERWLP